MMIWMGGFRSSNLIVWCPGFMDVLSGSTFRNFFSGLRVRPLGDNQDHSALKYEVLKYQMPTFQSNDQMMETILLQPYEHQT